MSLLIAEPDQKCADCRHAAAEHDTVVGCRHALMDAGERFDCVCSQYAQ